jgi:uncharacterized protein YqjF (DUF2071 family)
MIRRVVRAGQSASEAAIAALPGEDFSQSEVIGQTANRPWPVPEEPWLMAQTWRDLLFAHWPLPPEALARVLPPALPLDTFDGRAWIGVTPFEVSGLRPRGALPVPRVSRFPELNVRTYVSLDGKPGIFFLSLDAASSLAVLAARRAYRLPYFRARMTIERRDGEIRYECGRISPDGEPAAFTGQYGPRGAVVRAAQGSLEYFLTERYCLYTVDETGRPLRADIQHPPWPLQPAGAAIATNSMTRPWRIELPAEPPLLHYARLQQVVIWPLRLAA